jgi:choline dehydrogenase
MLSGVGPSQVLRRAGIPVVLDAPGVGQNLHDHPNVPLFFLGRRVVDCLYPAVYGFHRARPEAALPAAQSDTCYVFYPARSSLKQATKRVLPGLVIPQAWYGPLSRGAIRGALDAVFATGLAEPVVDRVWGIVVILGKPKSRGTLTLRSPNPAVPALVDPAYFDAAEDMETLVAGVRRARRIAGAAPLAGLGNFELSPGPFAKDDAALASFVRKNAMTTFHFAGTCRMGDDAASVVDTRLRFLGLRGLRVADASVIPFTPVAALNAPSMVIGYRAARFVLEEHHTSSNERSSQTST